MTRVTDAIEKVSLALDDVQGGDWKYEKFRQNPDGEADCGLFAEVRCHMAVSVARAPRYETEKQYEANFKAIALLRNIAPSLLAVAEAAEKLSEAIPRLRLTMADSLKEALDSFAEAVEKEMK